MTRQKPYIVLIEDNPGDIGLLRFAMQQASLDCDLAIIQDGEEALAMIARESRSPHPETPSLVVLDLNLPRVDGREVLAALRATPAFSTVPVAILTSSPSPRERREVEEMGIARYLVKPPTLDEFVEIGPILKGLVS